MSQQPQPIAAPGWPHTLPDAQLEDWRQYVRKRQPGKRFVVGLFTWMSEPATGLAGENAASATPRLTVKPLQSFFKRQTIMAEWKDRRLMRGDVFRKTEMAVGIVDLEDGKVEYLDPG